MKETIPPVKMPDRFVLDKDDIEKILSNVKKHWNRNELTAGQNAIYTSVMVSILAIVRTPFVSIDTLKNIYFSVMEASRQLDTLNTLKLSIIDAEDEKAKQEFEKLFNIQWKKIENGAAFE